MNGNEGNEGKKSLYDSRPPIDPYQPSGADPYEPSAIDPYNPSGIDPYASPAIDPHGHPPAIDPQKGSGVDRPSTKNAPSATKSEASATVLAPDFMKTLQPMLDVVAALNAVVQTKTAELAPKLAPIFDRFVELDAVLKAKLTEIGPLLKELEQSPFGRALSRYAAKSEDERKKSE